MAKKTINLGDRLQQLRKAAGFTQSELSRKIEISHTQLTRYEVRGVQPPADVLKRFADVFGTSIDFIVCGDKNEYVAEAVKDAELVNLIRAVGELPKEEKNVVVKFVGAYVRDYKAKKAYSS